MHRFFSVILKQDVLYLPDEKRQFCFFTNNYHNPSVKRSISPSFRMPCCEPLQWKLQVSTRWSWQNYIIYKKQRWNRAVPSSSDSASIIEGLRWDWWDSQSISPTLQAWQARHQGRTQVILSRTVYTGPLIYYNVNGLSESLFVCFKTCCRLIVVIKQWSLTFLGHF